LALQDEERDLHLYLRNLEEVALRVCHSFELKANRVKGRTGAWIQNRKIAAIGVRARSWITFHGLAFNRTKNMEGFNLIVPCGISDAGVTSLESELGHTVEPQLLEERFFHQFAEVFHREVTLRGADEFYRELEKEKIWPENT